MTQENKLLLEYLCMALPYGVKLFKVNEPESAFELYSIDKESGEIKYYKYRGESLEIGDMGRLFRTNDIPRFKPYLRLMSSMTEEERNDYQKIIMTDWVDEDINGTFINAGLIVKWLLKNHFDFMGLIHKHLAIDCTNLNIY